MFGAELNGEILVHPFRALGAKAADRQERPDNGVRWFRRRAQVAPPLHLGPPPVGPVRFHPGLRTAAELVEAQHPVTPRAS
ncbi:MAG TPA: hypothetical protein VFO65_05430 [Acidimicrobiales bacterium]|nr:hypothetical protein [Acidimicrobiales bacterium]